MNRIGLGLLLAGIATGMGLAQQEGPQPTAALVRVEVKKDQAAPVIDSQSISVKSGGQNRQINSVAPILGKSTSGVQVIVMMDDGLRTSAGRGLDDLQAFVQQLPASVEISIGYMQDGRVVTAAPFTTNHEEAAKAIRIPMGARGISASPYFCLSDYVKRWPVNGKAHIVLMITNGVDPYNGRPTPMNQNSPYVDTAKTDALRAGVAVYSIYFSDAGMRGAGAEFSGQSYLGDISQTTGGVAYGLGLGNPISFGPYLKQFLGALDETYRVDFMSGGKGLVSLKVSSNTKNIKISAPAQVQVGNGVEVPALR